MKREHLASWLALRRPRPLLPEPEPEPELEPWPVEIVEGADTLERLEHVLAARRREPAQLPRGPRPWYTLDAVPMRVLVARWAFAERDDDAAAAAAINRAAADLADELEPIEPAPELVAYRPTTAAARERDALL